MSSASTSSPTSPASTLPEPHSHAGGKCPITSASGSNPHAFCPPQYGDSRAPCPALNTMANHGYLPRDGKRITAAELIKAMKECFALSNTLAAFLTHGALFLLGQSTKGGQQMCLHDIARHGGVEHDASLYHPDANGEEYAPIYHDAKLFEEFFADSKDGKVMNAVDVAKVRARRETSYPKGHKMDFIHAELARGEIAIVLNCFNNPNPALHAEGVPLDDPASHSLLVIPRLLKKIFGSKPNPETTPLYGVPLDTLRFWFEHERLPEGWKPYHKTTLRQTIGTVNTIRSNLWKDKKAIRKAQAQAAKAAAKEAVPVPVDEKTDAPVDPAAEPDASPAPLSLPKTEPKHAHVSLASDGTQTLEVRPPMHSKYGTDGTVSSATSSTFTDMPPTPQASEIVMPPFPGKDAISVVQVAGEQTSVFGNLKVQEISGLPRIVEPDESRITELM